MLYKNFKKIKNSDILSSYKKSKSILSPTNIKKIKISNQNKNNSEFRIEKIILKRDLIKSNQRYLKEKNNSLDNKLSNDSEKLFCASNNKFTNIIKNSELINKRKIEIIKNDENKVNPYIWKKTKKEYYIPILNKKEKESLSFDNNYIFKKNIFNKYNPSKEEYYNKNILKYKISRNKGNNYNKNKELSKLLINCKSLILNKSKKENKSINFKKSKFVDILQENYLIRKRLKDEIIRRNKSYYTHSFNLNNTKNISDNEDKGKETLNNFVLNNYLSFGINGKSFFGFRQNLNNNFSRKKLI